MKEYAVLSSKGKYSSFNFRDCEIKFRTSEALNKYVEIKQWDNGYLVVIADYKNLGLTEEYIDLSTILRELYFDEEKFLKHIKEVKIEY
jgi:sulfur relay (sulfurtransferase) DsrC/TusE family protein